MPGQQVPCWLQFIRQFKPESLGRCTVPFVSCSKSETSESAILLGSLVNGPSEALRWKAMKQNNRRAFLTAGVAAAAGAGAAKPAKAQTGVTKKVHYRGGQKPKGTPLFSGVVSYGNLVFIAGIGAHFEGDIKAHTAHVLDEVQKALELGGSSMNKVLKCNVYLNDLKDYAGMNEVFKGRFGDEPPVRTTIAAAGGIPGNSLVEIDVIAYV